MPKRFVSIWFRSLKTDWFILRNPSLSNAPFVVASPDHGRMMIVASSTAAQMQGIKTGMLVADVRAIVPSLQVFEDKPRQAEDFLKAFAEWCIRFTPFISIDLPEGLIMDVSGCAHLWGGEVPYLKEIVSRLRNLGYHAQAAMADTIGTAWAVARYGKGSGIIGPGKQLEALMLLPPEALRLEPAAIVKLHKLGLRQISSFISMPRPALHRRFGTQFIERLDEALGHKEEMIEPFQIVEPYQERLPCLEPIVTASGIEIALQQLLKILCIRLSQEEKGLRQACLRCLRVDGKIEQISIGTHRPSHNKVHLFKLFEDKISSIEPDLGIELFILIAGKVEDVTPLQESIWETAANLQAPQLSELIDRLAGRIGAQHIHRYLPDEHYWPERSFKPAGSLDEQRAIPWKKTIPRPLQLLSQPEPIKVVAPIPDYPPILFRYKGKVHTIKKADGPERIEQEWWLQSGQHRDYYYVEDEDGNRYWLFRSGHYESNTQQWFIHGFFA